MTPHRIVHWKSFWFGVLVLVFLVWAWLGTRTESASLSWSVADRLHGIVSGGGSLGFAWAPAAGVSMDWEFGRHAVEEEEAHYFAPAFEHDWEQGGYDAVAYWVVGLGFFVSWSGFLMWRWRRVMSLASTDPS